MPADAPTLLRRLLLALLPALLAIAAVGGLLDYRQVRGLADEAYDQALVGFALGLAARLEAERDDDLALHLETLAGAGAGRRFVVTAADGHLLAGDVALEPFAKLARPGPPTVAEARVEGQVLRIASLHYAGPDGSARIAVGETLDARRAAARRALRTTAWTNLLTVLAVLAAVVVGVRAALRPLARLGAQASRHEVDRLQPLPAQGVPGEVRPLVDGINRLIDRLRGALQARQVFLDDAAHQLRTPLAALQAQLDVAADDARGSPQQPVFEALQAPVRRMSRLAHQMLALARAEAEAPTHDAAPVDLCALLEAVAGEQLDAALARDIDLGVDAAPAAVTGERWMLHELLANLVDNALRHAPAGSAVTLRCGVDAEAAFLAVDDEGPGIPPAQRERVFERFVRGPGAGRDGSGLGLAIVREAARRHGARVRVLDGRGGRGTCVRVDFPAPDARRR